MWFEKKATEKDVRKSFKKRDEQIEDIKKEIVSKKEIELMIRESALRGSRTPRTTRRKRADKLLDKAEIYQEIASMLQKGLSTTEAFTQIVNVNQSCKKTCFYKYLNKVREQLARTPRTSLIELNKEVEN